MDASRSWSFRAAAVALAAGVMVLALGASAGAAVTPERWTRTVCRSVSSWLDTRTEVEADIADVLAKVAADDLTLKAAKKRLTKSVADGVEASESLIDDVKAVGTPKIDDGKAVAKQYQATLADYRAAYEDGAADLAAEKGRDAAAFAAAVGEINATLIADLDIVGVDPIEELRAVEQLAAPIAASCGDVEDYLGTRIDPACTQVLDTIQKYLDAEERYQTTPEGSPEETAAADESFNLTQQMRNELGACNRAGVASAACLTTLETAQRLVDKAAEFIATPIGSPEETAVGGELDGLSIELAGSYAGCRR